MRACRISYVFVQDVSLPEVSREDLPARVQEFLRLDDEKLELEIQEETAKEVSFLLQLLALFFTVCTKKCPPLASLLFIE